MTTTTNLSIDVADGWTAAAVTGSPNVLVQLLTDGPVLVYVGAAAPTGGQVNDGIMLSLDGDVSWTGNNLGATDIVYVKVLSTQRGKTLATAQRLAVMAAAAA